MHSLHVQDRRPFGAQVLGPAGVALRSKSVGNQLFRQSVAPSSPRDCTLGFRSWTAFRGLIAEFEYCNVATSDTDKIKALLEVIAWCVSDVNQVGTIAGEL